MTLLFKNNSGATIEGPAVINLTGVDIQDNGEVRVLGDQPDSAANFLIAVTGPESVSDGKYGYCSPVGEVLVMPYDTGDGTPANEENWGPDNGTHKLKKNFGGGSYAVIGADTDSELAVVMMTGLIERKGKSDGAITAGSTGTCSIYTGAAAPASWTDTSDNVTARNMYEADTTAGDAVLLKYSDGEWWFLPIECA